MDVPFTQPWADAFCAAVNADAAYREASLGWTWPIALVLTDGAPIGVVGPVAIELALDRGTCRTARIISPDAVTAPFVLGAPLSDLEGDHARRARSDRRSGTWKCDTDGSSRHTPDARALRDRAPPLGADRSRALSRRGIPAAMSYDAGWSNACAMPSRAWANVGAREKNVFGGRGFLLGKNTFVIAWGEGIIAKIAPDEYASAWLRQESKRSHLAENARWEPGSSSPPM
jgi:hypothetical protein